MTYVQVINSVNYFIWSVWFFKPWVLSESLYRDRLLWHIQNRLFSLIKNGK